MRRHSTYERVVLLLLIGFGIIAAALIARAGFLGGFQASAEIIVAADAERVWPYLETPDLRIHWQTGIVDLVSTESSEIEKPIRFLLFYHIAGKSFEVPEIIRERREPSLWRADRDAESYRESVTYTITEASEGHARISLKKARTYRDFRDRLLAPFTGFSEAGRMERSLDRLAFLLNEEAANR